MIEMNINKNQILGIAGLLFSLFYIILSFNIMKPPGLTQDILGSRAFPIGTGILMGLCSLGIIFVPVPREEEDESVGVQGIQQLLPYVLIILLYILLLPILGTIIATTLFMFVMMNRMSKKHFGKDLIIAASISLFLWFIFSFVMKIPLPTSLLGFI